MDKNVIYRVVEETLDDKQLFDDKLDYIANLANFSALLFEYLEQTNWVGFYLLKDNRLVVGPFQGKPAHNAIDFGKGVCGTAWKEGKTQIVKDVHLCENHIECDSCTNSEIVVPIYDSNNNFIGVLDIDSPRPERFDSVDAQYLEKLTKILSNRFFK